MQALLSRLPDRAWLERHRGKLVGMFMGTFGSMVLTVFLVVAITGTPYGTTSTPPEPVYIIE